MRIVKLLHVGDLHYPDLVGQNENLDLSDKGFPGVLRTRLATHPSQSVAREMARLLDRDTSIKSILICGDITSKGNLDGFRRGLSWLAAQLRLENRDMWPVDSVHAVPGNHDVNRRAVTQTETDIYRKFEDIERAWADQSDLVLTVRGLRITTLGTSPTVTLHSLNSCLGCGEYRGLPDAICDALWRATTDMIDSNNFDDYNILQYEQLDTPAFDESEINELVHSIKDAPPGTLPIVLAHHNILPQGLVRISPYTEIVNGGNVRRRLSSCGRPVLYLHGHIHEDPIEDITRLDGTTSHGSLITVSAPEIREGFNVLSIVIGKAGVPIGCAVETYRRQHTGDVVCQGAVRIPLVKDARRALSLLDDAGRAVLRILGGSFFRFHEVLKRAREQQTLTKNMIIDRLREASWLGLVIILDEEQEPEQWQIQGVQA
jgi:3',5'-cyclic AMP phosphodiesterase CpdA